MRTTQMLLACMAGTLLGTSVFAQTNVRIRGTITAVDGNVVSIQSREGKALQVHLTDTTAVAVAKAIKFEDIKQGDFVGSAAKRGPDGSLEALEVHYLPPTVAKGHTPWDLEPDSTMTNALVTVIAQSAGKRELTLAYDGGSQTIKVPANAPIVRAVPGTRADLVKGEYVFTIAQSAADGKLTTQRIQVSKDGVKPPM
ncbi:MAG: hypothetical protein ACKVQU_20070 [Burkholderiales bacterium]